MVAAGQTVVHLLRAGMVLCLLAFLVTVCIEPRQGQALFMSLESNYVPRPARVVIAV